MRVTLKSITPDAEVNIVEIARVSSPRVDKAEKPEGLILYLIKNKHWSPFEHSHITFEIVTSKSIGIQLLRHVSFRFQEFSQRYAKVEHLEDIEFRLQADKNRQSSTTIIGGIQHMPDGDLSVWHAPLPVDTDAEMIKTGKYSEWLYNVEEHLSKSLALYEEGLELGIAKESARFILPLTAQTTIYMTGNIRSWIHMLQIRDDSHAQKEVQLIAKEIKRLFVKECPIISKALTWDQNEDIN